MAWRNLRLNSRHVARDDAGDAGITMADLAAQPKARLLDDRNATQARFSSSAGGHTITLNRGPVPPPDILWDPIDRVIIPNHDITSLLDLDGSGTGAFAGEEVALIAAGVMTSGTTYDATFLALSVHRHLRLTFASTGQWSLGQLILTRTRELTRGPVPGWDESHEFSTRRETLHSNLEAVTELGPKRRTWRFELRAIDHTDTDVSDGQALEDLVQYSGLANRLVFEPPWDSEALAYARVRRLQRLVDAAAPATRADPRRRWRVELVEDLA